MLRRTAVEVAGSTAVRNHVQIVHSNHSSQLPILAGVTVVAAVALLGVLVATGRHADEPEAYDPSSSVSPVPFTDPPDRLDIDDCADDARPNSGSVERVATLRVERTRAMPGWLAYLPSARTLLVPGPEPEVMTSVTLFGDIAGTWPLPPGGAEQATIVDAEGTPALGTMQGDPTRVVLTSLPYEHAAMASTVGSIDMRALDLADVTTLDAGAGSIAVIDRDGRRLVQARMASDRVTAACELHAPQDATFRAVARRGQDGHLFAIVSRLDGAQLVEMDVDGSRLTEVALPIDLARATAMVFAPSTLTYEGDAREHLYVLSESRRRIVVEVLALAPESGAPRGRTVTLERVRATSAEGWVPPSADPTGVTYDVARGALLVTDSEVDERGARQEANVWVVSLVGGMRQALAFSPSTELTDVAADVAGRRTFLVDDGRKVIHVWEPGADGLLGTSDDRTVRFSTTAFGCNDPEGLAYGQGSLFIADGAGQRVFRLTPGANGSFDGIHARSDDEVSSFDVGRLGLADPEGIEYHPDRGTLLVLDREDAGPVLEVSTAGTLIRRFDLADLGFRSPSGLALGPSSDDPARLSLYVVDRGIDNAADRGALDGQLVELRLPNA